jgi:hypothetical protein
MLSGGSKGLTAGGPPARQPSQHLRAPTGPAGSTARRCPHRRQRAQRAEAGVDRIVLIAAIGICLLFGSGVLAGIILMVSTVIRGDPPGPPRRTRPYSPGTDPRDEGRTN